MYPILLLLFLIILQLFPFTYIALITFLSLSFQSLSFSSTTSIIPLLSHHYHFLISSSSFYSISSTSSPFTCFSSISSSSSFLYSSSSPSSSSLPPCLLSQNCLASYYDQRVNIFTQPLFRKHKVDWPSATPDTRLL